MLNSGLVTSSQSWELGMNSGDGVGNHRCRMERGQGLKSDLQTDAHCAYKSQPTAEGGKNQDFPTSRAGQLRPKENHGHTASHSALDTRVSWESAPGSSHHT